MSNPLEKTSDDLQAEDLFLTTLEGLDEKGQKFFQQMKPHVKSQLSARFSSRKISLPDTSSPPVEKSPALPAIKEVVKAVKAREKLHGRIKSESTEQHAVRLLAGVNGFQYRVHSAEKAAEALTSLMKVAVAKNLNFTRADRRVYLMVYRSVLDEHQERGLSLSPSLRYVHGFIVQDALAGALGMCLKTVYRAISKLEEAAVLAARVKYTLVEQDGHFRTRAEGTVVNVLLRPEQALRGQRVWVQSAHLKNTYRNLGEDINADRTAFKVLSGIHHLQKRNLTKEPDFNEKHEKGKVKCPRHVTWKEVDQAYQNFRTFLQKTVKGRKIQEEVKVYRTFDFFSLKTLSRKALGEELKGMAERLAARLSDQHSVRSYLRIFWRTVHLYWEGRDHTERAQQALEATFKDMQHSKVRTPGALFRHHLKVRNLEELLS